MTQIKLIYRPTGKEFHANQFEINIGAKASTVQAKIPDLGYQPGMKPADFDIPAFTGLFDRVTDRPVFVGDVFAGPDDQLFEIKGYHKGVEDFEATQLMVVDHEDVSEVSEMSVNQIAMSQDHFRIGNRFEPTEQLKRKIPKFREMTQRIALMKAQLMQPTETEE